jgi:hypothetical protein
MRGILRSTETQSSLRDEEGTERITYAISTQRNLR